MSQKRKVDWLDIFAVAREAQSHIDRLVNCDKHCLAADIPKRARPLCIRHGDTINSPWYY